MSQRRAWFTDLSILQDVVDKHHSTPGIQQLLHIVIQV